MVNAVILYGMWAGTAVLLVATLEIYDWLARRSEKRPLSFVEAMRM